MRTVMYILTTLAVVGLAFWAYRENYATQQALSDADKLHANIRNAHARLVDQVAYPPAPMLPITDPVDVSTMNYDALNGVSEETVQ